PRAPEDPGHRHLGAGPRWLGGPAGAHHQRPRRGRGQTSGSAAVGDPLCRRRRPARRRPSGVYPRTPAHVCDLMGGTDMSAPKTPWQVFDTPEPLLAWDLALPLAPKNNGADASNDLDVIVGEVVAAIVDSGLIEGLDAADVGDELA